MRYYCTLLIRSNAMRTVSSAFRPGVVELLDFEDTRSEANLARAARLRDSASSMNFVVRNDLPRYCWSLNSRKAIDVGESDIYVHVYWLLSQLKPAISLADLQKRGVECKLAAYWGGQGTGGGPLITPELSELLCRHKLNLGIGFYFEK